MVTQEELSFICMEDYTSGSTLVSRTRPGERTWTDTNPELSQEKLLGRACLNSDLRSVFEFPSPLTQTYTYTHTHAQAHIRAGPVCAKAAGGMCSPYDWHIFQFQIV